MKIIKISQNKNKSWRFIFKFDLMNEEYQLWEIPIYAFPSNLITKEDVDLFLENNAYSKIEEMKLEENYGIHDVSFSNEDLWGYNSYEVSKEKIPELMNIWENIWTEWGFKTGDVKRII